MLTRGVARIERRLTKAYQRAFSPGSGLTVSAPERFLEMDNHFCQALAGGKFGKVSLVVDFGIGAVNVIGRRDTLYYSPAFIELATRLLPILGPLAKIVGIDCNSLVAEGNCDYVRSRPDLRDRLEILSGSFGALLTISRREKVDLIIVRNVLGHYAVPEREEARRLFTAALREGGHIIEGNDVINVVFRKTEGRLKPVELNILIAAFLGLPDMSFWDTTGFANLGEIRAARTELDRILSLSRIRKRPKSKQDMLVAITKYFQELKRIVPLATREQQFLLSLPLPITIA